MPSLNVLDLNKPDPVRLPASKFPERADVYVCDRCGTDLTKYLHWSPADAHAPYGPEMHICQCGRSYVTGAKEWDSLVPMEKRNRIGWLFFGFGLGLPAGFV